MQLNTVLIKEEKLRFKKRVPAMRSHFLLLICCIFRLASAEHLGNSTVEEPTRGVYDAQIFMEYFRWHGVHNIMLVVCPQDVGKEVICYEIRAECKIEKHSNPSHKPIVEAINLAAKKI